MTTTETVLQAALGLLTEDIDMSDVRLFPKEKTAISIKAPVIIDATTQEGVQPLLDLVKTIRTHGNVAIAQQESQRLNPYFSALSVYLTNALNKTGGEDPPLKKLTTPGALSGIFNALATNTRNTLTSEVIIAPRNIANCKPTKHLFSNVEFNKSYNHRDFFFDFGFLQVFEKNYAGSTTLPLFTIDRRMMGVIAPHHPEALLKDFQDVMTIVNHDMLHHFTSPIVNSNTAHKFNAVSDKFNAVSERPFHDWDKRIPAADNGEEYEDWAQVAHEKTLLTAENTQMVSDIHAKIDHYFDELKRIGESLGNIKWTIAGKKKPAHDTVDFFGMMMAHALTRLFPLNHPLMLHCMNRLQEADPAPEDSLSDFIEQETSCELTLSELRNIYDDSNLRILKAYRGQGFDIFPDDDAAVGYINIKLLQLIKLSPKDIIDHMPPTPGFGMGELRAATDKLTLDMIRIAARTSNYDPS